MGREYTEIDAKLAEWIRRQHLFFVATAPLSDKGHINNSPKGGDAFRILGPRDVAYMDYTGSGAETVAHLRENGRIVIMFCALEGPPKILRLHGRGRVVIDGDPEFSALASEFTPNPGARAIVRVAVERIADSCGYAVPRYTYQEERETLDRWATEQGPERLQEYRAAKNQVSIDGLPAFDLPD